MRHGLGAPQDVEWRAAPVSWAGCAITFGWSLVAGAFLCLMVIQWVGGLR